MRTEDRLIEAIERLASLEGRILHVATLAETVQANATAIAVLTTQNAELSSNIRELVRTEQERRTATDKRLGALERNRWMIAGGIAAASTVGALVATLVPLFLA